MFRRPTPKEFLKHCVARSDDNAQREKEVARRACAMRGYSLAAQLYLPPGVAAGGKRSGSGNLNNWDKWIFCLTAA